MLSSGIWPSVPEKQLGTGSGRHMAGPAEGEEDAAHGRALGQEVW